VIVFYASELVGKAGLFAFKNGLPAIRKLYAPDFVIACADGLTGGNGLGRNHAGYLRKIGAEVITLGECCFYKKDLTENLEKLPYVLRPENLNPQAPGSGLRVFRTTGGEKVAVAVLLGQSGFSRLHGENPCARLGALSERLAHETNNIILDFHAQASAEKRAFFYTADGLCSAVIGSHNRVQTADAAILPGGTACITDAGRSGSLDSVGGADPASRITEYMTGIPDWTKDAWDNCVLEGVVLELDAKGKAVSIEPVRLPVEGAPRGNDIQSQEEEGRSLSGA
jgi:metallophosphoesterase (TIGR00282 family)